ncbi:MAG TPA: crossover junction endodeoxyribonuclease RuvC [Gemmataceae bacterium]|jgi:crossover junction endodeoxyribonuclease RuvC|nr:crossover junction endodeoxyribonuclease RuvC [Gemmataceae bacterium]
MASARILGIDPGLHTTGYAVLEVGPNRPVLVEAGIIKTAERRATPEMADRLTILYDGLIEVINLHEPTALSIEQLYAHYDHPRTAILMGHARGVILLAAGKRGMSVASYAATSIKKTVTGSGRASKEQMQATMLREFGLSALPEPHDVADAMAIALCHYHHHGLPPQVTSARARAGVGVNLAALNGD